jgi:hypothetical protein
MPYITGKDGTITFAGDQMGGLSNWEAFVLEVDAIRNDGQGDDWRSSVHVVNGWEGSAELEMPLTARESYMPLAGTEVEMIAQVADDDAEAFIAGTVRITRCGVRVTRTDKVTIPIDWEGVGEPTEIS